MNFLLVSLITLFSLAPAAAQNLFALSNGQLVSRDVSIVRASQLDNQMVFYDALEEQYILLRNLKQASDLRVVFLDQDYKVKKIIRPPQAFARRAFSIVALSFYPTSQINRDKYPGKIIFDTDKGFLFIDLLSQNADLVEFGNEFTEGIHQDAQYLELKTPVLKK